ncbi:MAG: beta-lactamase family protein ['Candidatus Kapabacteria' thiocyanatum]|nr:beta-lactamase family protein ['Candidatus Kapabacteria' thiocyanatum]
MKSLLSYCCAFVIACAGMSAQVVPADGDEVPSLRALDTFMLRTMERWNMPGGQLAVTKNGRLVYSRAFGYADTMAKIPATRRNLFRIASSSKPVTGTAIQKLVAGGRLHLDDKVVDILAGIAPVPGATRHADWDKITVRHLMMHSAGFANSNGDPQYEYLRTAARACAVPVPADPASIIRYMLDKPLDYQPGTAISYSNFGFNLLGRIIEAVTGMPYERYVRDSIFAPAGITAAYIGKTRRIERMEGEVVYYVGNDLPDGWSVMGDEDARVSMAYGADYHLPTTDAHGGWVTTATDLVRYLTSLDPTTSRPHILPADQIDTMVVVPAISGENDPQRYQGLAFRCEANGQVWTHAGILAGASSLIWRDGRTGVTFTWIFNSSPITTIGEFAQDTRVRMDAALAAIEATNGWPDIDLFGAVSVKAGQADKPGIDARPNPAEGHVTLTFGMEGSAGADLIVADSAGRIVVRRKVGLDTASVVLQTSGWMRGAYSVRIGDRTSAFVVR